MTENSDLNSAGEGVSELRMDFGKGYRIYYSEKDGKNIFTTDRVKLFNRPENLISLTSTRYL